MDYTIKDLKDKLTAHLMALDFKTLSLDELKTYTDTVGKLNDMDKEDTLSAVIKTMGEMNKPVSLGNTSQNAVLKADLDKCCCCTQAEMEAHVNG